MPSKSRVIFVRHAQPMVDETVPSQCWPLSENGRLAAQQLASRIHLAPNYLVVASDEIKAHGTAEALSDQVVVDPRLGEVQRPWTADNYRVLAETWLRGTQVQGWESTDSAVERMAEAVTEAIQRGDGSACLVTHGLIMSAYIGRVANIDPVALWSQLEFPDVRRLDFDTLEVHGD